VALVENLDEAMGAKRRHLSHEVRIKSNSLVGEVYYVKIITIQGFLLWIHCTPHDEA